MPAIGPMRAKRTLAEKLKHEDKVASPTVRLRRDGRG
jgi:hypothetical protein